MHVVVAGAGIGGLAAALAMARSGVRVTVLERRPAPAEYGAGLQLSPNATRILARLGLLDRVRDGSLEPRALRLRRGRDAADLVRFPLQTRAAERYGAPFLLILRPELLRLLASVAEGATGVDLRFSVDVRSAVTEPHGTAVIETSVGSLRADGFVDARGVGAAQARHTGRVAWRALVPSAGLKPDHRAPETNLWLGDRAHLVHYPLPEGDRVNVVAVTGDARARHDTKADFWSEPGDPDILERAFENWHADARQLLDRRIEWRRWPLMESAPLEVWSQGPLTLLGDAAHAMLPFLAQGASQAIEDAGCLGSSLSETGDVASAFTLYDRRRRARATLVQKASRRQAQFYHLGRPTSDARDLALRLLGGTQALARMDWLYQGG